MGRTKELLLKIRDAVSEGKMALEEIPVDDIKQCVFSELEVNSITFPKEQYIEIVKHFEILCQSVSGKESDRDKVQMLMDALILCVDMISPVIYKLINRDYWCYKHQKDIDNPEITGIIEYIDKEHEISPISYGYVKEYAEYPVEICFDLNCGMHYIPYKGRRMFFPVNWDEKRIMEYYRTIMVEQDRRSPHCYYSEACRVEEGDVVVDAGAAEGIFSLDCIDKVSKIYLIEADEEWIGALKETFRDDGEKVQIIYGFLGSIQKDDHVSLDGLFEQEEINYIKMDIEGAEQAALAGADKVLEKGKNIRCAICAYHCSGDEKNIREVLERYDFVTETSKGYMCPIWEMEAYLEAEVRRGLVFGRKG